MLFNHIAIVVIGRNEGERLLNCLKILSGFSYPFVYVDSGSRDDSINNAKLFTDYVINLSTELPFTAARARNEGFYYLKNKYPKLRYVQFIDGDCELSSDWLKTASEYLDRNSEVAIVFGHRKEKFPKASIYNSLCNLEWANTGAGLSSACGGDFMCREAVFDNIGGFDLNFIAGEEPEMCFRIVQKGSLIHKLQQDMTLHDANITTLGSFLKRIERGGYAACLSFIKHGSKFNLRVIVRILIWGFLIPVLLIFSNFRVWIFFLLVLQLLRLTLKHKQKYKNQYTLKLILAHSGFLIGGKIFEFIGMLKCVADTAFSKQRKIIEYKS